MSSEHHETFILGQPRIDFHASVILLAASHETAVNMIAFLLAYIFESQEKLHA